MYCVHKCGVFVCAICNTILYRFIAQCVHVHKSVRVTMKACSCTLCELPGM